MKMLRGMIAPVTMVTIIALSICFLAPATACVAQDAARSREGKQPIASPPTIPPSTGDVLIYCDKTPGALFHADIWQRATKSSGETLTYAWDGESFATLLAAGSWSRVVVLAKYAPGEPSYARALRGYAEAQPDRLIQMMIWHDHGTRQAADTAVLGSTAIVLWNHGRTTTCYAMVTYQDPNPKAREPQTVRGHVFPDFQGVQTKEPTFVARARVVEAPGGTPRMMMTLLVALIRLPNCELGCALTYGGEVATCNGNRDVQVGQCQELYGPSGEDPGNPAQYATCVGQANITHTACLNGAAERSQNCLALCERNGNTLQGG